MDLNSSNSGCARLGSGVAPLLGVVIEDVAVLIVLVRRHRRAVGTAVRRAVDDEVPGAVEEEAGPFLVLAQYLHPPSLSPLHPAALASVPYGVVLVRVRVRCVEFRS